MNNNTMLKPGIICYFGTFPKNQAYSRNLCIEKSLRSAGWKVVECRVETKMTAAKRISSFTSIFSLLSSLFAISGNWFNLFLKHSKIKNYDYMIVGYPSHIDVFLASILTKFRGRPLIMDAFIGLYDTVVRDRKLISELTQLSKLLWLFEWMALHLADKITVDTQAHKDLLIKEYRLNKKRVFHFPVGIDEDIWKPSPLPQQKNIFRVAIWSTFIPLHGMPVIAEAAAILIKKDYFHIKIHVIGDGQTADQFAEMIYDLKLKNINWKRGFFDINEIVALAQKSHCCLGILGSTEKTKRVVPYKINQALALSRPVITADTSEMRRIFQDAPGGILIPPGDGKQLAEAIITLSTDHELCQRLALNCRAVYNKYLSNAVIVKILSNKLL